MKDFKKIVTDMISRNERIDEYDTPICPHCGKHYEKSGEHDCNAVLKIWRPGGREFIGDKELK